MEKPIGIYHILSPIAEKVTLGDIEKAFNTFKADDSELAQYVTLSATKTCVEIIVEFDDATDTPVEARMEFNVQKIGDYTGISFKYLSATWQVARYLPSGCAYGIYSGVSYEDMTMIHNIFSKVTAKLLEIATDILPTLQYTAKSTKPTYLSNEDMLIDEGDYNEDENDYDAFLDWESTEYFGV